jgi:hypothetical protein
MTANQLRAALRKWKVPFVEETRDGIAWYNHNRNSRGAWGPVNGVVIHHTGDDAPDTADLRVLWYGRTDLGGPLCLFALDDKGTQHLVGLGRTNHAGGGDPAVLKSVIGESYEKYPPATREHQGSTGAVDGNAKFYGQETMYSGLHGMTSAAYVTTVLTAAAICDFHNWSAKSVIGHREWSDWKVDPGSLDMAALRADIDAALEAGPGNWPTPPKPVEPPKTQPQPQTKPSTTPAPYGRKQVLLIAKDSPGPRVYLYGFSAAPVYLEDRALLGQLTQGGKTPVVETTQEHIDYLTRVHIAEQTKLIAALAAALRPVVGASTPETVESVLEMAVTRAVAVMSLPTPVAE